MAKNSKRIREKRLLSLQKKSPRCRVESFNVDLPNGKYRIYQAVYNVNLSLIRIVPEVSQQIMSGYRGTTPAVLPLLVQDVQDEVLGI